MTTNTTTPYTANATTKDIAERLRAARTVTVITHAKPDGDAAGSVLALTRALRRANINANPIFTGSWNTRFDRLLDDPTTPAPLATDPSRFDDEPLASADTVAVLDTGAAAQLDAAAEYVRARSDRTLIIDHHAGGDANLATTRLIDTTAPAACVLVAEVAVELLDLDNATQLPPDIATPLYLGLATDTGWFKHPSVTPRAFRLAGDLLEAGANHNELFLASEHTDPPGRLTLVKHAINSLELIADNRAAVMRLTAADFADADADPTDASGLVDIPKSVGTVEVSALLTEIEPGRTKLSLRSKAGTLDIDVNALAATWLGGGHKHAAGAKIDLPIEQAATDVATAIKRAIADASPQSS